MKQVKFDLKSSRKEERMIFIDSNYNQYVLDTNIVVPIGANPYFFDQFINFKSIDIEFKVINGIKYITSLSNLKRV